MSETHFRGRVAQKALIVKDNNVLITRDSRDNVWELPGGRLDDGEEPKEGILREIREELGVEASIEKMFDIKTTWHDRDKETMIFIYYIVSLVDDDPEFKADPLEVAEMEWVDSVTVENFEFFPQFGEVLKAYFEQASNYD